MDFQKSVRLNPNFDFLTLVLNLMSSSMFSCHSAPPSRIGFRVAHIRAYDLSHTLVFYFWFKALLDLSSLVLRLARKSMAAPRCDQMSKMT